MPLNPAPQGLRLSNEPELAVLRAFAEMYPSGASKALNSEKTPLAKEDPAVSVPDENGSGSLPRPAPAVRSALLKVPHRARLWPCSIRG
jgi:hypothetical protein